MRVLHHSETLLYYDYPLLFSAQDQLGVNFVCLLINQAESEDEFLCVPLSKGRLNAFRLGDIDLLNVFSDVETEEYFVGRAVDGDISELKVEVISPNNVINNWMPEPGVYLEPPKDGRNIVLSEAKERQRAVIYCTLNPPEAYTDSKITVEHLSEAITLFQRLIKYSYENAIKDLKAKKETLELIKSSRNYTLEVYGASPGSFTIHMQTVEPVDMLGYSQISKALDVIDSINLNADDPQIVMETLSEQKGHFVSAYKNLLQFIIETNTPFAYEWSMPSKSQTTKTSIVPRSAKPLYEAISEHAELGKEEVRLTGRFTKIDEDYNKWRLVSDDNGKRYYGDSYIKLGGIVIETVRYELLCEEVLEEDLTTKKETKKLYLKSYHEL